MRRVTNVVLSYFPGSCRQPWLVHSVKCFPLFLQQSSLWIPYVYNTHFTDVKTKAARTPVVKAAHIYRKNLGKFPPH